MAKSQQTYPYDEIVIDRPKESWIEISLSKERLNPYMSKVGNVHNRAFNLYLYNARIAKAFLFPLHILEVTLRNRIQGVLSTEYCSSWHQDSKFRDLLQPQGRQSLDRAQQKARSDNIEDIIANSTFEFWTYLLHKDYDDFWRKHITALIGNSTTRGKLFDLIKNINLFRNRIAHHEPILDKSFKLRYNDILEALKYLNPEVCDWVKAHSTIDATIKTEPSTTGSPQPLLKEMADVKFSLIQSTDKLIDIPINGFLYCEDKETVFDLKELAKYFMNQVNHNDETLMLDISLTTINDVIKARKIKKNTVEFGETESFLHSKVMFQGKRIKYIIVKNSQNEVKGIIEKPHRQL
ncbi:Abi family protein [Photobacterium phosphoreum]|uniref:Abi family protein n=1 Tax=Photobacterium phosphoreum TaxID=659 RepID=UPI000D17ED75|nr:Abi family protein [Photobacterium phosphoreum]PSU40518.1 hypothetical protein CTM85_01410 [Photobacterium phosphoreum]